MPSIEELVEGLSPLPDVAVGAGQELPCFTGRVTNGMLETRPHLLLLENHWRDSRREELPGVIECPGRCRILAGFGHDATSLVHLLLPVHLFVCLRRFQLLDPLRELLHGAQ